MDSKKCQRQSVIINADVGQSFRNTAKLIFRRYHGDGTGILICELNSLITCTERDYSCVQWKRECKAMDRYLHEKMIHFLRRLHPKKSRTWIYARYVMPDPTAAGTNGKLFRDPRSGEYLRKLCMSESRKQRLRELNQKVKSCSH